MSSAPVDLDSRPARSAAEAGLLFVICLVLVAVGVLLAVIESFLVPWRLFGSVEGVCVAMALLGNLLVGVLGGLGARSQWAACAPVLGWFVTVGLVTAYRPGGDVIFPARLAGEPGVAFVADALLVAGVFGGALGLVATAYFTARPNAPKPGV